MNQKNVHFKLNNKKNQERIFELHSETNSEDEIDFIYGAFKANKNKFIRLKILFSTKPREFLSAEYCPKFKQLRVHCEVGDHITDSDYGKPNGFKLKNLEINLTDCTDILIIEYNEDENLYKNCEAITIQKPNHVQGNIIVGGPGFIED